MEKALATRGDAVAASLDFEGLKTRHHQIEQRLSALERHLHLTPSEQVERTRLKKEKVFVKDQLAAATGAFRR